MSKKLITAGLVLLAVLLVGRLSAQVTLGGTITNEANEPIANVPVVLSGDDYSVSLTGPDGTYSFQVPASGFYTITPQSADDVLNGVSTFDVVMVWQHIDNVQPLDSPYDYIAADVNNDQQITLQDTVDMRDVIIGVESEFPNNESWRFVDADFVFPDPMNPWQTAFPEIIQLNQPEADILDLDFIAVKIGDLNISAQTMLNVDICDYACGYVSGSVFYDEDLDCTFNGDEMLLEDWIVTATSNSNQFITTTNQFGIYTMPVFPDDYTVTMVPPNSLWQSCQAPVQLTIEEDEEEVLVFGAEAVVECAAMDVSLGTPLLRACFPGTYFIDYCNQGTITAEDAYVDVTFDSFIEVVSSSIPWSSVDGNTYTFELGDLDLNECGTIVVQIFVSCDGVLGQTYCSEAAIYPNFFDCLTPSADWDGAQLELDGTCEGDSLRFEIRNIGETMQQEVPYFVVEDDMIMMTPSSSLQLSAEEVKEVVLPANGSTWRLEVHQTPFNPFAEKASLTIEGCGENEFGDISLGFVNLFPHFTGAGNVEKDCVVGIGAYDPNDKLAVPAGVAEPHYIERNVELEYTIRFQNTGTDTAFNVVLLDTLTEHLDILSIRPGASSHDYHFNIIDGNVLEFAFPNIMLPDSNINEPASHGFVKFRIQQQQDLALGTLIENSAAIYFDFNEPVITNTFFHTVGEDFLEEVTMVWEATGQLANVVVYPNPADRSAIIYVDGLELREGTCILYDAFGREVGSSPVRDNQFTLDGSDLSAGMYFFKILEGEQPIGSGRLTVQ